MAFSWFKKKEDNSKGSVVKTWFMSIFTLLSVSAQDELDKFIKDTDWNQVGKDFIKLTIDLITENTGKDISGEEKKAHVDKAVGEFIDKLTAPITNMIYRKFVDVIKENIIPWITQQIYNLLKKQVENL